MKKKKTHFALLFIILLIASFFRLFNLQNNPPGFFSDEASIGYNAYLIAHNARDEYGIILPFFFESFGDYKPGLPIYLTALFNFFRPSEFTTRLPFALSGIGMVVLFYFLGKVSRSTIFGLTSALIASITPWAIHYSRIAFELITFPTVLLGSLFVFFQASKNPYLIPLGYFLLALTFYTYRAAFVQTPLIAVFITVLFFTVYKKHLKFFLIGLSLFLIVSVPFILSIIDGSSLERAKLLSPPKEASITEKVELISENYTRHFSYKFLFLEGDNIFITRHFLQGFPPLFLVYFPLIIIGALSIIRKKDRIGLLIIFLLLIYPLPGSLTQEPPFTSRSILGIIPLIFLTAEGICSIYAQRTRGMLFLKILILLLLTFTVARFGEYYFIKYPQISSDFWGWQYGARDIVNYFKQNENNYDQLIMAPEFNTPEIFIKFYAPGKCQKCLIGLPDSHYSPTTKQLFAVPPSYLITRPEYSILEKKRIYHPNGSVAFIIGEVVQ